MDFQSILAALPTLRTEQLDAVVALAQALRARGGSGQNRGNRGDRPKTKKAGPAKQVSKYADDPHYKAFKDAEKILHVHLKETERSLKDYDPKADNLPQVVVDFFKKRDAWFLAKTSKEPTQSSPAAKPLGEEKKA